MATFGFDISAFSDFAKSEGKVIIQDLILGANSFEICAIQDGIKSSDIVIDISLNGGTYLQSGDYTGAWAGSANGSAGNFSGTTKFANKTITVKELFVKELYKKLDIERAVAQMLMKQGSSPDDLPEFYRNIIMTLKGDQIRLLEDYQIWQGQATGYTNTYQQFSGFLNQLQKGESGALSLGAKKSLAQYYTGTTAAQNVINIVEGWYQTAIANFPQWIETNETIRMYMSPANYDMYFRVVYKLAGAVQDALTLNVIDTVSEFRIPGTKMIVTRTAGLNGLNNVIITRENNLVVGCDLQSENEEQFKFEYLNESMIWRLFALFKLGCLVVRPTESLLSL